MTPSRWRNRSAVVAAGAVASIPALFAPACSSGGSNRHAQDSPDGALAGADDGGDDSADVAEAIVRLPTFTDVYQQVLVPNCALPFCHAGTGDYLELADMSIAYSSLVNAPAQGPGCAETGLKRVDPGHPETSLLYLKITTPPCGDKMPRSYGSAVTLDPLAIDQIKEWITLGAKDD